MFLSGHEWMICSFWTSARHKTSLKREECVCVRESVSEEENDKISQLPLTWSCFKSYVNLSSFSIACLGKDEEPFILTIQFCPVLSVFLLRCFLFMFMFAQSCASLSMMAWLFSQRVFEKLAHCHLREHLHFSCLHKSFTGCHYIIVIFAYYTTHQMLKLNKKHPHSIWLHVLTSWNFGLEVKIFFIL